jgi:hypothetical protein
MDRESFLRFMDEYAVFNDDELCSVLDVMKEFNVTEDCAMRIVIYCWMLDEIELPEEVGDGFRFILRRAKR